MHTSFCPERLSDLPLGAQQGREERGLECRSLALCPVFPTGLWVQSCSVRGDAALVWPCLLLCSLSGEWAALRTLVLWKAAVKAFEAGHVDVSEGGDKDETSPWV